jgi:hypothetical protein
MTSTFVGRSRGLALKRMEPASSRGKRTISSDSEIHAPQIPQELQALGRWRKSSSTQSTLTSARAGVLAANDEKAFKS